MKRKRMTRKEEYAFALLGEEGGEVAQVTGKATRFGIDTPRKSSEGRTARDLMHEEVGDVLAAADYAVARGVLDRKTLEKRRRMKLKRLLDPKSKDSQGNRFAP